MIDLNQSKSSITIGQGYKKLDLSEEESKDLLKFFGNKFSNFQQGPTTEQQLKNLKKQLSSTDYQVIKCYEYSLAGLDLPYDITALHEEREALRVQIRKLEEE